MLCTIIRFNKSKRINIAATVEETARRNFSSGTFHLENIAFGLEVQGVEVLDKASVLTHEGDIVGLNQIRTCLNAMTKYRGDLMKLQGGWYTWVSNQAQV